MRMASQGQSANLLEDLRRQLDLFQNDYAAIRVYWKFYGDKGQKTAAEDNNDPKKLKRAYFLYLSRSKSVIELDKSDVRTVLDYCSQ